MIDLGLLARALKSLGKRSQIKAAGVCGGVGVEGGGQNHMQNERTPTAVNQEPTKKKKKHKRRRGRRPAGTRSHKTHNTVCERL